MTRITVFLVLLALAAVAPAKNGTDVKLPALPGPAIANADAAPARTAGPARDAWPYTLEWKFSTNNVLCVGLTPVQDTLIWVSSAGHTATTEPNWIFVFDARSHALLDSFGQFVSTDWGYRDMCYDPAEDVVYAGTDGDVLDKLDATNHTLVASYTVSGSSTPGVVRALAFDGDSLYSANFDACGVVKFATDGTGARQVAPVPPYAAYGLAIALSYGAAYMTTADETGMVVKYDYPSWTVSDTMVIPELGPVHGGCEMWLGDTFLLVLGQNDPMDSVICLRVIPPSADVGVQQLVAPAGFIGPDTLVPSAVVRNYGTASQGPFDVRMTVDPGGYTSTKSVTSLAPGDTTTVEFDDWAPSGTGLFTARCTTLLAGDEVPGNDFKDAPAMIADFVQDFETTSGGYVPAGGPSPNWTWGEPAAPRPPARSGTKAWGGALAGEYPNYADWRLNSVSYVAVQDTPVLGFFHWYLTERRYDGGNVKFSTDGGATWTLLYPWEPYSAPYDTVMATGNSGIPDEWGYSGDGPGDWAMALFQVPVDSGTGFMLRWHFGTDLSITDAGWVIDDVAGIGFQGVADDVGCEAVVAPTGIVAPCGTEPVARIRNFGTAAQGPFEVVCTIDPGGYSDVQTVATIAPYDTAQVTFTQWIPSSSGLFTVRCSTKLATDQVPANDARSGACAVADTVENFEGSNGSFVADNSPSPGWDWGAPGSPRPEPPSPVNAWAAPITGEYVNDANWKLTSLRYQATIDTPAIVFWHWYHFEQRYDGGNVKLSTDGGSNWSVIYPWEEYSEPYDTIIASTNAAIPDEWGYTGRDSTLRLAWFRIPVAAGTDFHVRWHCGTDGSVTSYYGWMIDDVACIGCEPTTGTAEPGTPVPRFALGVKPNPAADRCRVDWSVARAGDVLVRLYDITGSEVRTLCRAYLKPGDYRLNLATDGLSRGIYLLRLETDGRTATRKLILR